jgi:putative YhdH/YhfP family quinone oxidoreductase
MENRKFRAFLVSENENGRFTREIVKRSLNDLPAGDVVVKVAWSSLNYKDALSATGNKGVTRSYPHTPGIDAAGTVEVSQSEQFKPGEEVIVTSYDLGMNTAGGFAEYIRVPADWVVKRPKGLSCKEAMIYGTAGFTAGLSVNALIHSVKPEQGDILVTGASGGVGSVAVSILTKLGYQVAGVAGMEEEREFLASIGVKEVIRREDATDRSGKPVLKTRWAGVIDTVGGDILATAIKMTAYGGAITCCGNAASPDLPLNVFPFILRGVRLLGIDSQNCPMAKRQMIWDHLADDWKLPRLLELSQEITLEGLEERMMLMLQGKSKGRTVVKITG